MQATAGWLVLLGLVGAGYLLAHRLLPWLWVRAGRLCGLRMELSPLTARRLRRFRRIRRGYWSFVLISTAFTSSLFLELVVNHRPLYVRYGERVQLPAVADWLNFIWPWAELPASARWADFGLPELGEGELDGRRLAQWIAEPAALERLAASRLLAAERAADEAERAALVREAGGYRRLAAEIRTGLLQILMPPYPFSAAELLVHLPGSPPYPAVWKRHGSEAGAAAAMSVGGPWPLLGTDFAGRDVLSQLLYGFRVSFAFALVVALVGYAIGISAGAIMGYFGGWIDIAVQRLIEIWGSMPFLYIVMILAAVTQPDFLKLAALLIVLRSWLGITYTVRGEFYREKAREYVQAARALGVPDRTIMRKHILPNALVPVVTFMPFDVVAYIGALVSLDFLGFGLPPEVPSWGRLLRDGAENIRNHPELVVIPVLAFALTLYCVVMIGEAVREAFDPKEYARLR
ncbi:MAG: hypothetical protein KatS3mg102_1181 [Planctomycetota bacterium]|nr:MAG: hypothetical protein KatS3mg102_1181 [Planctomycetota bacterium]